MRFLALGFVKLRRHFVRSAGSAVVLATRELRSREAFGLTAGDLDGSHLARESTAAGSLPLQSGSETSISIE